MRVLVITQYYKPERFRINDLVDWFAEQGHEMVVLTGMPNYPTGRLFSGYGLRGPWYEKKGYITVIRVPLIVRGKSGGLRLIFNYLSFAVSAIVLGVWRCRGRYDAVFVHAPSPITVALPGLLAGWIKRAPVFLWVLDLWPETLSAVGGIRNQFLLRSVNWLVSFVYRYSSKILVQSLGFISAVMSHGISRGNVLYFPSWAEELFTNSVSDDCRSLDIPEGFRLVFTGNIGAAQDFGAILDAAENLRDRKEIQWIIVGDGRLAEWVRDEIVKRELVDTVHLMGAYPLDQMPIFLRVADAVLITLKKDSFISLTIPAKLQSYLAMGRPIVAMMDGEGAKIINQSNAGFVVPAGDAVKLARAVNSMVMLENGQRETLGSNGRKYYETHFERVMLFKRLEAWLAGRERVGE